MSSRSEVAQADRSAALAQKILSPKTSALAVALWLAILAVCAILRPLQMDEVFQIIGVRTPHMASVFSWLRVNPASVPGVYLLEWALVRVAGASAIVARLPSLAAWIVAAVAMVRVGRRAGVRAANLVLLAAAVTPMMFRYAIEGRPYMPAFCMTVLATLQLLAIIDKPEAKPRLTDLGLYAVLLTAGPMIQGTAVTVTLAHALFVLIDRSIRRDRVRQTMLVAAIVFSLLLPVIWSLAMRDAWADAIAKNGYTFGFGFRPAFGFLEDITGGGIVCTALLGAAAIRGFLRAGTPRPARNLLALIVVVTIFGSVASDALAGYFISPRQAIYCLGGLIVLAAAGCGQLHSRYALSAWLAIGLFTAVALGRDVSIVRSKENWRAASEMAKRAVAAGFCLQPTSDLNAPLDLYSFFDPSLRSARCGPADRAVGLIYSTYTPQAERDAAESALVARGLVAGEKDAAGGTTIARFTLPPSAR